MEEKSNYFFGFKSERESRRAINTLSSFLDKKDVVKITDHVLFLEGLEYLTPEMKGDFFKSFDHQEIGIAIKFSTQNLFRSLFKDVSSNVRKEVLMAAQGQYSIAVYTKNLEKVSKMVRAKVACGQYLLSESKFELVV